MHALQTAILQHTTPTGIHHDWLIEDPTLPNPQAPDARLWTARITPPPADWLILDRFDLTIIPPHRRHYLTYQGPVSNNRGHVKRLASGTCNAKLWSTSRIVLTLQTEYMHLNMQLQRMTPTHWLATTSKYITTGTTQLSKGLLCANCS